MHGAPYSGTIVPMTRSTNGTDSIGRALFGKVRSGLLALLFCHSDRSFYFRQIVRLVGVGQGAVQRELSHLLDAGLVNRTRIGNQVHYQANVKCSVFRELKSLMVKTSGVADVLRNALAPMGDRVSAAFIYGSLAKGTETGDSDIDVIVIGNVTFSEVTDLLGGIQETVGREVNPSVYPDEEFATKVWEGHHFLSRVIGEPKIFLIGDEDGLRELDGKRLVDRT